MCQSILCASWLIGLLLLIVCRICRLDMGPLHHVSLDPPDPWGPGGCVPPRLQLWNCGCPGYHSPRSWRGTLLGDQDDKCCVWNRYGKAPRPGWYSTWRHDCFTWPTWHGWFSGGAKTASTGLSVPCSSPGTLELSRSEHVTTRLLLRDLRDMVGSVVEPRPPAPGCLFPAQALAH